MIDKIINGLTVIKKYDQSGDFAANHDEIMAGGPDAAPDKMTEEDQKSMESNGWYWTEHFETWIKLV